MSYGYVYSYKCDECETVVSKKDKVYTCPSCTINLCRSCFKKRDNHLCIWCHHKASDEFLWKKKMALVLMLISPLILLFFPIPQPSILSFFVGSTTTIFVVFYMVGSFSLFGLMRFYYSEKVLKSAKLKRTVKLKPFSSIDASDSPFSLEKEKEEEEDSEEDKDKLKLEKSFPDPEGIPEQEEQEKTKQGVLELEKESFKSEQVESELININSCPKCNFKFPKYWAFGKGSTCPVCNHKTHEASSNDEKELNNNELESFQSEEDISNTSEADISQFKSPQLENPEFSDIGLEKIDFQTSQINDVKSVNDTTINDNSGYDQQIDLSTNNNMLSKSMSGEKRYCVECGTELDSIESKYTTKCKLCRMLGK